MIAPDAQSEVGALQFLSTDGRIFGHDFRVATETSKVARELGRTVEEVEPVVRPVLLDVMCARVEQWRADRQPPADVADPVHGRAD